MLIDIWIGIAIVVLVVTVSKKFGNVVQPEEAKIGQLELNEIFNSKNCSYQNILTKLNEKKFDSKDAHFTSY